MQLLADVAGYFVAGDAAVPGAFVSLAPSRVLDTRSGHGGSGPVAARGTVAVHASDSMFRSYSIDLSGVLRVGENEIVLTFRSPEIEAAKRQAAQPYFVPFSANNTPILKGNMLRKPSCCLLYTSRCV